MWFTFKSSKNCAILLKRSAREWREQLINCSSCIATRRTIWIWFRGRSNGNVVTFYYNFYDINNFYLSAVCPLNGFLYCIFLHSVSTSNFASKNLNSDHYWRLLVLFQVLEEIFCSSVDIPKHRSTEIEILTHRFVEQHSPFLRNVGIFTTRAKQRSISCSQPIMTKLIISSKLFIRLPLRKESWVIRALVTSYDLSSQNCNFTN